MIEKLKQIFLDLYYFSSKKVRAILDFIYEIIINPIKNISILIVICISWILYENIEMNFNGKTMILMSAGLVSIIKFISNYLAQHTVDIEKKENFYLGYNVKKIRLYDNFWLKQFNNLNLRLLFWIMIIMPSLVIVSEQEYKSKILNKLSQHVEINSIYIFPIWTAVFIVCSLYCVALLIESVALSNEFFLQSNLYITANASEKINVEIKVEHLLKKKFDYVFNFKALVRSNNDFKATVKRTIDFIFYWGNTIIENDSDIEKFYNIAFRCEENKIDELINNVKKKQKFSINALLFKKNITLLKLYYTTKWDTLNKLNVLSSGIINIAIQDLKKLLNIEKELHQNAEDNNILNNTCPHSKQDDIKSNLCISQIAVIIEEKFRDPTFIDNFNDIEKIMCLFKILNNIDEQTQSTGYVLTLFDIIFECTINDESKDKKIITCFSNKIKDKNLPKYLVTACSISSKSILMSGDDITNYILEYLLAFLQFEDIVVVLIFRLAYAERSNREVMDINEFRIWENAINKYTVKEHMNDLNTSNFIDVFYNELSNSNASHFLTEEFIKWLWESLFEKFDEDKYLNFINLGKNRIRINFSLKSYILVRLLLRPYDAIPIHVIDKSKKNKVIEDLSVIKNILNEKGVYF